MKDVRIEKSQFDAVLKKMLETAAQPHRKLKTERHPRTGALKSGRAGERVPQSKLEKELLASNSGPQGGVENVNGLTASTSRRVYDFAIEEFIAWYYSEPRLALNRNFNVGKQPDGERCNNV